MKKTLLISLSLFGVILFTSCGEDKTLTKATVLELDLSGENKAVNPQTLIKDETNSLNQYCRVDSIVQYGFGWEGFLSSDFQNKKVKVVISCKVRANESLKAAIVLGVSSNNELKFYGSFPLENYITELNTWTPIKDSLYIEPNLTAFDPLQFSSYIFKPEGKGYADMDDFKIKLEVVE